MLSRKRCRYVVWDILVLSLLGIILFCPILSRGPLQDPDESRYAEIPREMMERGDYITPTLNYVPYFEKPPLQYWVTILSYKILGVTPSAARIWPGFGAIAGMLLTYWLMSQTCGRRSALISAIVQATCLEYFVLGNVLTLDMLLTTLINGSVAAFYLAERSLKRQRRRVGYSLFWMLAGLAVLCKGLVGIVLPFLILLVWAILTRRWAWVGDYVFWLPALAFFCIVSPWFIAISARYPSFVHFFFVREHLERFLTNVHNRWEPTWFFFAIAAGGMMPWTVIFILAFWRAVVNIFHAGAVHRSWEVLMVVWLVVPLLFFSASHSKEVPYILPIFVPSSMLVGRMLARQSLRIANGYLRWTFAAILPILILGPGVVLYVAPSNVAPKVVVPSVLVLWLGTILCFFLAAAFSHPGTERYAIASAGCGAVIQCLCLLVVAPIVPRRMAPAIQSVPKSEFQTADILVSCGRYYASLSFYTKRRIAVVGSRGELSFGSQYADRKWFPSVEEFRRLWCGVKRVIATGVRRKCLEVIPRDHPGHFLWLNDDCWIVSNHAIAVQSRAEN